MHAHSFDIMTKKIYNQNGRRYKSLEDLERKIQAEGVPPDDHTLYTDSLEWRAINHEVNCYGENSEGGNQIS